MFSKFVGTIKHPSIRNAVSKENLTAGTCDIKPAEHQLQSPSRGSIGSAWRCVRGTDSSIVVIGIGICFLVHH